MKLGSILLLLAAFAMSIVVAFGATMRASLQPATAIREVDKLPPTLTGFKPSSGAVLTLEEFWAVRFFTAMPGYESTGAIVDSPRQLLDDQYYFTHIEAGFPLRCFVGEVMDTFDNNGGARLKTNMAIAEVRLGYLGTGGQNQTMLLPLRPIWWALLLNIVFYFFLMYCPLWIGRAAKAHIRRRKNACFRCGYPVLGETCPECGETTLLCPEERRPA